MHERFVERGLLEIYRFVPSPLLEGFDPERAGLEEFLDQLARARFLQEVEEGIVARAIVEAFSE